MTAMEIHREYKKLQRIRKFGRHKEVYFWLALVSLFVAPILVSVFPWMLIPAFVFFVLYFETKPKHEMHYDQYRKLEHAVQMHQNAFHELIGSGAINESEIDELLSLSNPN